MKPVAAFAVGLWTGALVMAAVGMIYLHVFDRGRLEAAASSPEQLEARFQLLQQEQAKAVAENQRLRQTVAELQSPAPSRRLARLRSGVGANGVEPWIVDGVLAPDTETVTKLEQAALQSNLAALDGLALLAEQDNAAALTRVWASSTLTAVAKERATMLLAATVELNPHGAELLESVTGSAAVWEAVLAGLAAPDFASRLVRGTGITPPPHFKPDFALRLRIVENLRQAVADEVVAAAVERVRSNLLQRVPPLESTLP